MSVNNFLALGAGVLGALKLYSVSQVSDSLIQTRTRSGAMRRFNSCCLHPTQNKNRNTYMYQSLRKDTHVIFEAPISNLVLPFPPIFESTDKVYGSSLDLGR